MERETVYMTKGEKMRLKDQLLAFVDLVIYPINKGRAYERTPEEMNAIPAIVAILRDGL